MTEPRIYIVCPDTKSIQGGFKTIYRQAEVLTKLGYHAHVLHRETGFRPEFFPTQASVQAIKDVDPKPDDILVLPEIYDQAFEARPPSGLLDWSKDWLIHRPRRKQMPVQIDEVRELLKKTHRVIILNLNGFHVFRDFALDRDPATHAFNDPRIEGMIVVSRQNEQMMRLGFPNLPLYYFHKSVDPEVFKPTPPKQNRICFFPRKQMGSAKQVMAILKKRGRLDGFELVPMKNMTQDEVAEVMGASKVFLSFSESEGLPRPPMEAMMAGCVVVGFHGQGGKDYMLPEYCYPIEGGDYGGYVEAVERVLDIARSDPTEIETLTTNARDFVVSAYSPEVEFAELEGIWSRIIGRAHPV